MGRNEGQAQAADSDEAHVTADKKADTSSTMPAAAQISHLEKFVRHFAALNPAEAEATLEEYSQPSSDGSGSTEWSTFVRHTWLPVVSVACGSDWKDKFNSDEVEAMLTLHRSLVQPRTPATRPSANTTSPARTLHQPSKNQHVPSSFPRGGGSAAIAAAAGRHLRAGATGFPVPDRIAMPSPLEQAPPASSSPDESDDNGDYYLKENHQDHSPASAAASGQTDSVDVDGKRRRLRRKRAASPEEHTADGASLSSDMTSSAPSNSTTPSPPRQNTSTTSAKSNIVPIANFVSTGAGSKKAVALPADNKIKGATAVASEDSLSSEMMTRLLKNISELHIGNNSSSDSTDVPLATPGSTTIGGGAGAGEDQEAEQGTSLATSLTLIHDLTHRLNTGLRLHDELSSLAPSEEESNVVHDGGGGANKSSTTALSTASSDVVKTLHCLLGASLGDRMDLLGRTALHVAVASGQRQVVAALVAAGCDVNRELPLDPRILQKYALEFSGSQATGTSAVPLASTPAIAPSAMGRQEEEPPVAIGPTTEALLSTGSFSEPGINVLATVMEPPPWPSKQGKYSVGDHPPDPSPNSLMGSTPVHLAAALGDVISLESLLSSPDVDVNARTVEDATPLHWAARGGHALATAALCRASGIDLDAADSYGRTALHVAAAHGHESVVQQLWARGACIDPIDAYEWRPLHYATRHGFSDVASHLVIAGSQVQAFDPDGVTAGHLAAERGYVDILDKLLIAGYLPDAAAAAAALFCDSRYGGSTALHLAASHGHLGAVEALLRWSANPQALDSLGCTPLDVAVMSGHFHIAPVLIQAGSGLSYSVVVDDDDNNDDDEEENEADSDDVHPSSDAATHEATTDSITGITRNKNSGNMDFIAQGVPPNVPCPALKASLESQGLSVVAIDHAMYPGSAVPWSGVFNITFADGIDVPHHILLTDDDGKGIGGKITLTPAAPRRRRRWKQIARQKLSRLGYSSGSSSVSEFSDTNPKPVGINTRGGRDPGSSNETSFPFTQGTSSDDDDEEDDDCDDDDDSGPASEESIDDPPPPPPTIVSSMLYCLHLDDPWSHSLAATISPDERVYDEFGKAVSFTACAAATGKIDVLEKLYTRSIEKGIDFTGVLAGHALLLAVRCGKANAVQWLIEKAGCTPATYFDHGLLVQAAYKGHVDVVEILLKKGWDPNQQYHGSTALQEAAMCGHLEIAQVLLSTPEGRATVDIPCSLGYTPLHHAAESGIIPLVETLITAGASVNAVTNGGKTPAHIAAKVGHISVLEILRKAGANLGALDTKKWSPLHYIARRGDLATFVLLHSETVPLLTPASAAALLTAAVRGGSPEMVGVLLTTRTATPTNCREANEMPVHAAAREGFLEPLAFLSEAGFDLTAPDAEGRTPLHHVPTGYGPAKGSAARHEAFVAVADVLLAAGCRADTPDSHLCTPLHIAAGCGSSDMLSRFMDLAPDAINAADQLGWTPLFWAASEGHVFAVRMLLEGGASPTWKDCNERIPLHFAAEGGHLACVTALLDAHIASKTTAEANTEDHNGQTAVQIAAYGHHIECVAAILDAAPSAPPYGANPAGSLHSARDAEMKRRNALHLAASQGLLSIVDHLLECRRLHPGAKDAEGWAPLHFACAAGHCSVVYLLLGAPGVDADDAAADGDTPLHKAALGGHTECVTFLINAGQATVDSRNAAGSTPLYNASSQNHLQVMKALLTSGAAPDAPTSSGCTPLYIAANNGWPEAVDLLIKNGAKIDLGATQGCTALHAAALNGQTKAIQALLHAGADVDAQSTNGSTPLHNAAANGHKAAVEALLKGGADTEVENTSGNTPLHMSAGKGWAEVVELLINAGADVTVRNHKGYLAVQSAASGGFFDVVLKLVHSGAPWRQKGDADVVKLLSRKTTLRVSYVEGRLRLAEKERHRKLAKGEAVGGGSSSAVASIEGNIDKGGKKTAVSTAEDLKKAKAQADAVMAALLEEEQEEKAKADRAKAKKEAKKQKKAAQRQAEAAPTHAGDDKKAHSGKNVETKEAENDNEEEEEEEEEGALLDEDHIVALAVAEKQRELAAKLEASGRKSTSTASSQAAASSNGNGIGVAAHHSMSFAQAQLRAKPVSNNNKPGGKSSNSNPAVRNGSISAGAAVALKPAMPIRSASEGLASAPAMPVVRAASSSSSSTQPSMAAVVPPPPPPPPPGQPPLVDMKPAGPYAAALAGKQPPPPQSQSHVVPAAPVAVLQAPQAHASTGTPPQQGTMPWGESSNASIPMQHQPQQQQARPPRMPPPGFQPDAASPPTAPAPVSYQQQQAQLDMMHIPPPPILSPNHQMQDGSGGGGFVPLFGSMDLSQQQQQQQQMQMQHQQMAGPIPIHQSLPLGLDWGLVNSNNGAGGGNGGYSPGMSVGGQYSLSSSMGIDQHGPYSFSIQQQQHQTQTQQSLQHVGGYAQQSSAVGLPPPHSGSYGAGGMMIGPLAGEAPPQSASEADGIDDVLRMQPWLLE